jgi:hypothetical protein
MQYATGIDTAGDLGITGAGREGYLRRQILMAKDPQHCVYAAV